MRHSLFGSKLKLLFNQIYGHQLKLNQLDQLQVGSYDKKELFKYSLIQKIYKLFGQIE